PGRRNRPDQRHLRIDRAGQGPDQDAAGRRRGAGAAGPLGHHRRRRSGRGPGAGRPGRGQAARRQPGPRRRGQHRNARTCDPGLPSSPADQLRGHRRTLHSGPRLPPAGGGRHAGRRLAPRSAAGYRRRRADHPPAGRPGQRRPATRRRPRHLADQDPLRRHRPGHAEKAGLRRRFRAASRHPDLPAQQRQ
ncbi:hypothetical protein OY671_009860, partial [Metschnikowia pulcherrima]